MASKVVSAPTRDSAAHGLNDVFLEISEAARRLSSDPNWASIADSLNQSAERGGSLVRSLQENPIACDLEGIVDCAVQFAGDVLRALHIPGVEFYRDIEPGIRLRGATGCWERALLKLLVNAGEAMKLGGIVEIHAGREGDRIEITVADSGPGIPQELLPHLFKPGFATRNNGAGTGLHLVESMVRRRGGRITAANRADTSGAEFRITLPEL